MFGEIIGFYFGIFLGIFIHYQKIKQYPFNWLWLPFDLQVFAAHSIGLSRIFAFLGAVIDNYL